MSRASDADRFAGVNLPDPGFSGDEGEQAAEVGAALAAYAADRTLFPETLQAISVSRLLVPVVAVAGEVEYDERGLAHDKTSDMATVLLTGRDGRTALLAFTGLPQLQAWNPEARPTPTACRLAAQSAVQDGAAALVLDVAGPTIFVIEGDDLIGVAEGWTLARVSGRGPQGAWAWIRPAPE